MINNQIIGLDGKPVVSQRYDVCPECGRPPKDRVPSSGFGDPYLICLCGHEFPELKCQNNIV